MKANPVLKLLPALLLALQPTQAEEFLKQLTPKDIKPGSSPLSVLRLSSSPISCAIPLKTIHAENASRIDPIAPLNNLGIKVQKNFDKGIAHPLPMPVCASR